MKNGSYILIKAPDGYPGRRYRDKYAYEHHVVWWLNMGEAIDTNAFVVHHKNKDTHDNRFENLEKLPIDHHNQKHSTELKERCRHALVCPVCGNPFLQRGNNYRQLQKCHAISCCSRRCKMIRQQQQHGHRLQDELQPGEKVSHHTVNVKVRGSNPRVGADPVTKEIK